VEVRVEVGVAACEGEERHCDLRSRARLCGDCRRALLCCWLVLLAAPVQESAFLKGAVACSSVSCTLIAMVADTLQIYAGPPRPGLRSRRSRADKEAALYERQTTLFDEDSLQRCSVTLLHPKGG